MFLTLEVKRFFEAWQSLRVRKAIPHYRALFDSMPADLIPGMMLFEDAPGAEVVVRFMGTGLVDLLGVDLTGEARFSRMTPKGARNASRNIAQVLGVPCGVRFVGAYGDPRGSFHEMEGIALPSV